MMLCCSMSEVHGFSKISHSCIWANSMLEEDDTDDSEIHSNYCLEELFMTPGGQFCSFICANLLTYGRSLGHVVDGPPQRLKFARCDPASQRACGFASTPNNDVVDARENENHSEWTIDATTGFPIEFLCPFK